ncbi:hypothetical protein ENC19_11040 [Verrucosispora sp. CWR15]|uniref:Uncharacterized protein n=1 Tax=Verrucosispora sioxanthis TaxID=2499994 RepID=A0A6M1L340_9ACTN|nr:hypothetical protein [Verrucosispora sioxanthis]NGM13161.1 hypothetical protein [Verrucosispora sioxanthis]
MVEATASVAARRDAHLLLAAAFGAPEPGCVGRCTCRRRPTDRHRRWPRSWRTLPATVWTSAAATALARPAELSDDPVLAADRRISAARHAWQAGEPDRAARCCTTRRGCTHRSACRTRRTDVATEPVRRG